MKNRLKRGLGKVKKLQMWALKSNFTRNFRISSEEFPISQVRSGSICLRLLKQFTSDLKLRIYLQTERRLELIGMVWCTDNRSLYAVSSVFYVVCIYNQDALSYVTLLTFSLRRWKDVFHFRPAISIPLLEIKSNMVAVNKKGNKFQLFLPIFWLDGVKDSLPRKNTSFIPRRGSTEGRSEGVTSVIYAFFFSLHLFNR